MRAAVLAVVVVSAGCNNRATPPAAQPPAAGPTTYAVTHPQRRSITRWVEQPGAVFAFEETPVFAKIPGYVKGIAEDPDKKDRPAYDRRIDTGSRVKAGQVLAELDLPELADEHHQKEALVRQAEQELEQARQAQLVADAEVKAAEAAVTEAKAGVTKAEADVTRWASESKRVSELVKGKVIDEQTGSETERQLASAVAAREEANARVLSADARVRKSKAQAAKAVADIGAASARVAVEKAEAARVKSLLRYAKITAPFAGVVSRRNADPGHLVRPDSPSGKPLFVVARLDPVRVRIDVPEADAALVGPGAEAKLDIPALGSQPVAGKVARVSWSLDPAARTLRAEIDLPNPENKLRPGMYVSGRIALPQPEAWALPAGAVVTQGDQWVCFEVRDGKAVRVNVRVGRGDGQIIELLKKQDAGGWADFSGSETVIADKVSGLTDGQQVQTSAAAPGK